MIAIQTANLTKKYGDIIAINGVDLEVEAGEIVGCLGPERSGKTTLLRLLTGLVRPTLGDSTVLGLSSVKLEKIEFDQELGPILHISGADLMNETPIYDIKPYLPYADSHPDAKGGFTDHIRDYRLQVEFPEELIKEIPTGQREALLEVLANDPRPRYQNRPDKVYGLAYGHKDIHFQVRDDILTVCDVTEFSSQKSFDKQNNV